MSKFIISCFFFFFSLHSAVWADRVAIIGGGAAGVVSAWLLEQDHEVTLYESQDRLGGHANSIDVEVDGKKIVVEAGAEFFNQYAYPHFMRLLNFYKIAVKPFTLVTTYYDTDGSDLIILPPYHDGQVEWQSLTPSNLRKLMNMKVVLDVGHHVMEEKDSTLTLEVLADSIHITEVFKDTFLYPFLAAGWGVTSDEIRTFSAFSVLQYMVTSYDNSSNEWFEVETGLSSYITRMSRDLKNSRIHLNSHIANITFEQGAYVIEEDNGTRREFDHLVFATNAKIAAQLMKSLPEREALMKTLARVRYYDTQIAIHGDRRFMPPKEKDWRVANVRYDGVNSAMTIYKKWKSKTPVFKSWVTHDIRAPGDKGSQTPNHLYALIKYQHPYTDKAFFEAQKAAQAEQGQYNLWFAGMWMNDIGSHEDAIVSAIHIAERLAPNSARLHILQG
ncbi:FAD-dependent oxidoreductase [Legionella erythra]|uniref:Amine oxidase, flavin containing n=1 Tax=Legionella erythra TaxID=448 RepID=A0A0W0TS30_LEGER|nr:FAD-dependent oxidoreductase [Legionella erythra]KTC98393.1 amine oxidase, flavin containing [Legionella erythra]